jgi:hypothetical protein
MSPAEIFYRARLALRKRTWPGQPEAPDLTRLPELPVEIPDTDVVAEAETFLREGLPDWHGGAPRKVAFDINYREIPGIMEIWKKNRHHHLTVMAAAYAQTKDERFAAEVRRQLADWAEKNPFPIGVNWNQPLEAGIRLIAWVWCERFLGQRIFDDWTSIYQHQQFIRQAHSFGSSANNHLIGEMAGLFVAASAWPVFKESAAWREFAREMLEREILKQTFPSGINREMAFSYHLFTLEFFLMALREGNFSAAYRERVQRMREVIPALTDPGGNLPRYGDSDEGHAFVPSPIGKLPAPLNKTVAFEDAGLYVMVSNDIFVLADAGPHGYLSIAAHAHADALAFTMSVAGQPILVDPGTFIYHGDRQWRDYFRSTRAHNTVVVHDRDQSTMAGAFLWSTQAKTTVHEWTGNKLVASHDGYRPIIHRRTFRLEGDVLTIEDAGVERAMLSYHLAPECRVEGDVIHRDGVRVRVTMPGMKLEQGWYSPRFGVKQESLVLRSSFSGSFTTKFEVLRG